MSQFFSARTPRVSPFFSLAIAAFCALPLSSLAQAQNAVAVPTPTPILNATPTSSTRTDAVDASKIIATEPPIAIEINGQVVAVNPAPVMRNFSVLVPLRGVLENLGATVSFNAATKGILISQGARRVVLLLDSAQATVDGKAVVLAAPPQLIGGSAFVPLRSIAQLFGYRVLWIPAARTVTVTDASGATSPTSKHRQALKLAGRLGIGISLVEGETTVSDVEAARLLDAAKDAGASLVKVRFDWGILEPTRGAAFQWPFYDKVVAGARRRGLTVEGVLGQSTRWASTFSGSLNPELWRNGAPRESEMKSWQNYVGRVVGRYKNDVQAWQVWEKTSADRFRSSQTIYRKFLLAAAQSVRASDANALLFAAEPGGLDLDVIGSLSRSQAAPLLDGVALYPASQNQPGVAAPTGDFLRPFANLTNDAEFRGSTKRPLRDFWIGGLSRPVLRESVVAPTPATPTLSTPTSSTGSATNAAPVVVENTAPIVGDEETRARLLQTFTPEAQADYLMQSSALALAAGSDKVFWSDLRDRDNYESIVPVNAEYDSGLLRRDFSPRPAFSAFKTLAEQIKGKKYIGSLALGLDIVALVFDDGTNASVAAWTTSGTAQLIINPTGQNPGVANSLYIAATGETQVLDAVGNLLAGAQVNANLTTRPIWITRVAYETRQAVRKPGARGVLLDSSTPNFVAAQGVFADFGTAGNESGLYWRKFSRFRSAANNIVDAEGRSGLTTEVSTNIFDPAAGKFFIFLDVDDDYIYLNRTVPVEITITVRRPTPEASSIVGSKAGFNIEYSTPNGTGRTPWQIVEAGNDWATFNFVVPDASFANRGGYDLLINTFGSKKNLVFGSVAVKRLDAAP